MKKERLDKYLVDHHFYASRELAKKAIMAGHISVGGIPKTKAGDQVTVDLPPESVTIEGELYPYVSRGGLKLEKGLAVFPFPVADKVFLDIGASTGGFTDCLLRGGARRVYAIDVGYGQLDWRLRNDERVVCMERTNFRYLTLEDLEATADATVMDVSFISITKLLPAIAALTVEDSLGIWLIKPQFEAGRDKIGRNGVVRSAAVHEEVLQKVTQTIAENGFAVRGLDYSPIRGPKGNIEFLCFTQKCENGGEVPGVQQIQEVVRRAHLAYEGKDSESDA